MLETLLRLVDLVKDRKSDPTEIEVSVYARQIAALGDMEDISACLVPVSWLLAAKLAAMASSPPDDELEEVDAETEAALIRLCERSMFASVAGDLAVRADAAPLCSPASVGVDLDPDFLEPIDVSELVGALKSALSRVNESGGDEFVIAGTAVDLAEVSDRVCGRIMESGTAMFSRLVHGLSAGEVVAAFVVVLEAQAFGAVALEQAGMDINLVVTDVDRLLLVWEMTRVLH